VWLAIVLTEVGYGLKVRHQAASQPNRLDVALALPFQATTRLRRNRPLSGSLSSISSNCPWEIERYRLLPHKVVHLFRQQAIEQSLRRIDLIELSPERHQAANRHIHRSAVEWQTDPDTASEIEARLAAYGIDQQTIN
jgi:hypothetical protein